MGLDESVKMGLDESVKMGLDEGSSKCWHPINEGSSKCWHPINEGSSKFPRIASTNDNLSCDVKLIQGEELSSPVRRVAVSVESLRSARSQRDPFKPSRERRSSPSPWANLQLDPYLHAGPSPLFCLVKITQDRLVVLKSFCWGSIQLLLNMCVITDRPSARSAIYDLRAEFRLD